MRVFFFQPPSRWLFYAREILKCERFASMRPACAFPRRAERGHHAGGLLILKSLDDLRTIGAWARRPVHRRDGKCAAHVRLTVRQAQTGECMLTLADTSPTGRRTAIEQHIAITTCRRKRQPSQKRRRGASETRKEE